MKIKYFLTSIFILLISTHLSAQNRIAGKLFYLSFMQTDARTFGYPDSLYLFVHSDSNTNITIDNPRLAGTSFNAVITAGKINRISLDPGFYYPQGSEQTATNIEAKRSVRITAEKSVVVYAMNDELKKSSATLVLPLDVIPAAPEYFITSYTPVAHKGTFATPVYRSSEFIIVAADNNVSVEITYTAKTLGNMPKDTTIIIAGMPKGMVYQVQSNTAFGNKSGNVSSLQSTNGDLTGTRVRVINGTGKIVVFAGMTATQLPWKKPCGDSTVNHLYAQVYPTTLLGNKYLITPYKNQTGGYVYRVMAMQNNTNIYANNIKLTTLNAGKYYTAFVQTDSAVLITSSNPVSVSQYMLNTACNGYGSRQGDASLLNLPCLDMNTKKCTLGTVFNTNITNHFINIVVNKNAKNNVFLDGNLINTADFTDFGNSGYSFTKQTVSGKAVHSIACDSGFMAVSYGIGVEEGYTVAGTIGLSRAVLGTKIQNKTDWNFAIFPNPAGNNCTINTENMHGSFVVKIYDLNGKLYLNKMYNQENINLDLNVFKNGIYLVRIENSNGFICRKLEVLR